MFRRRGFQLPVSSFNKRVLPGTEMKTNRLFNYFLETLMHGGIA